VSGARAMTSARVQPSTWRRSSSASRRAVSIPAAASRPPASSSSEATGELEMGAGGVPGPLGRLGRARLGLLELLGLGMGDERVDDLLQASVQDLLQAVQGEPDAVVGHARLLEVVGPDLLAAVPGPDLALALGGDLALLLLERDLVEARAQ